MFSFLPDFTPRDSHSLWYTSSRDPGHRPNLADGGALPNPGHDFVGGSNNNNSGLGGGGGVSHHRRAGQHAQLEWSELGRVRAEEQQLERRRLHVQNFGSTWLKPPGVAKTLHQMREEKREQEEHQEALRREQLAQELADAEAVGVGGGVGADGQLPVPGGAGGEGMDDVQLDGARDLDDDIPDADASAFGLDIDDDEDEDDIDEDDEDDEEEADDTETAEAQRVERQNDLMAQRMRMTDDAFREALARGDVDGEDMYGGDEELEAEDAGHMLDEDDLIHPAAAAHRARYGLLDDEDDEGIDDLDMDANLDDEVPEADESGGYEHTDSEAELTSSEEDDEDMVFVPRTAQQLAPPQSPLLGTRPRLAAGGRGSGARASGGRGDGDPRASMDLSSILSGDGSIGSSPQIRRAGGQGRQE